MILMIFGFLSELAAIPRIDSTIVARLRNTRQMAKNDRFLTVFLADLLTLARPFPPALKAAASRVDPVYPPIAMQTKVAGTVRLGVFIDKAAQVEKGEALTGNPMLTGPHSKR